MGFSAVGFPNEHHLRLNILKTCYLLRYIPDNCFLSAFCPSVCVAIVFFANSLNLACQSVLLKCFALTMFPLKLFAIIIFAVVTAVESPRYPTVRWGCKSSSNATAISKGINWGLFRFCTQLFLHLCLCHHKPVCFISSLTFSRLKCSGNDGASRCAIVFVFVRREFASLILIRGRRVSCEKIGTTGIA